MKAKLTEGQILMKNCIETLHGNDMKSILVTGKCLYMVVTRVNYSTAKLWLEVRNRRIKELGLTHMDIYQKPNWLCKQGWFRRNQDKILNEKQND